MYIRIWNESDFITVLNSGMYENLIKQAEQWMEEGYVITRSKAPDNVDYDQFKRAMALKVIAQEAKLVWDHDSSNYYDSYHKIIMRLDEKRQKGTLYKVKNKYYSSSSSSSSTSSSTSSTSSSSSSSSSTYSGSSDGSCLKSLLIFLAVAAVLVWLIIELCTVKVYMVNEMTVEGTLNTHTTYEYDKVGRLVEMAQYDQNGNKTTYTQYEYNSIGEPQGSITYTVSDGTETQTASSKYETNAFFYIIEDRQLDADGDEICTIRRGYNFKSLIDQEISYVDNKKIQRSTFEYDKKNLIKQTVYGYEDGEEYEMFVIEYTYDDNNKTECKFYTDDILTSEITYTYDNGLLVSEQGVSYDEDGEKISTRNIVYEYDVDEHLEKVSTYIDEDLLSYDLITCDENGNVIESVEYSADGESGTENITYQYEAFRMRTTKANRLQRERGEKLVIIDKGWF